MPDHLARSIRRLESRPTTYQLVREQLAHTSGPARADIAVQKTLDFMRLWAAFHFPRLLRAIDLIQRDVLTRLELPPGNYDSYANHVETLFLDSAIFALDEYGVPLELARKLEPFIQSSGDLDATLEALKQLDLDSLNLSPFEMEVLRDTLVYI